MGGKKMQILVIDLGSQYTLVIGRTLRELGVRTIILSPRAAAKWLENNNPKGIVLSGGSASVYEKNAPEPPEGILEKGTPILGICYGMQWLAYKLGGKVVAERGQKEYGEAKVSLLPDDIFQGWEGENIVWVSHGDSVYLPPPDFNIIALSGDNIAAISHPAKRIWGVQFHPEVTHTLKGKQILSRFLFDICGCVCDWQPEDIIRGIRKEVAAAVGDKRCLIGFSGGVDSSTLSAILAPVLRQHLQAVCFDTGALCKDEISEIKENAKAAGVNLKVIKAGEFFLKALGRTTNAEIKRKRFRLAYGRMLEGAARKFGAGFIIQGTLATDLIESGQAGGSALIKSHHNTGLKLKFQQLHPLSNLFKYEIRDLAITLGLPDSIVKRQPFPGPGLFIRVVGAPVTHQRLTIVRWADAQVRQVLIQRGVWEDISQLVVGLSCVPSVGIKGDSRVYGPTVVVRSVTSADFMTAKGYRIAPAIKDEIEAVVTKHPKIVRVSYDETNKPPATVELE